MVKERSYTKVFIKNKDYGHQDSRGHMAVSTQPLRPWPSGPIAYSLEDTVKGQWSYLLSSFFNLGGNRISGKW